MNKRDKNLTISTFPTGIFLEVWRRYKRHKMALVCSFILIFLYLLMILAPWITPNPNQQDLSNRYSPPSLKHWLGTDELGRDFLARLIHGARVSLTIAFTAVLIALLFGILVGSIAGYYGGFIDNFLMRFVDIMLTLPELPLLLILAVLIGANFLTISLFIAAFSWMTVARLVRAEFLGLKKKEFIEAAIALGASSWRIIFRHLLPNSLAPVIVAATLGIADAILIESALSFLGFGVQPPTPSWGNMLTNAHDFLWRAPYLAIFPGLFIALTVLSFNYVGDGLRDALDPFLKE